jgi:hypothetical protein
MLQTSSMKYSSRVIFGTPVHSSTVFPWWKRRFTVFLLFLNPTADQFYKCHFLYFRPVICICLFPWVKTRSPPSHVPHCLNRLIWVSTPFCNSGLCVERVHYFETPINPKFIYLRELLYKVTITDAPITHKYIRILSCIRCINNQ